MWKQVWPIVYNQTVNYEVKHELKATGTSFATNEPDCMLWRVTKVTEATALAIVSEDGHELGPEQIFLGGPDAILFQQKLFGSGSDGWEQGSI